MKLLNLFSLINLFLFLTKLINSQNVSLISTSICEIIEQFYTKYSRNIEIIDFSRSQGQLVTEITQNLNNLISVTVQKADDLQNWDETVTKQSILLFENFWDLNTYNEKDLFKVENLRPLKILVYCQNITEWDLVDLKTDLLIPHYFYFLISSENDQNLKLFTFDNRDDLIICHEIQQLQEINEFSLKTHNWKHHPIFSKKYKNFHKCVMVLGNFFKQTVFIRFFWDYKSDLVYAEGPLVWIIKDIQKHLNLSISLSQCHVRDCADKMQNLALYNVMYAATLEEHSFSYKTTDTIKFSMLNIECT